MPDQIECVGGPLDGNQWIDAGERFDYRIFDVIASKVLSHIYHLESGKYVYKGVRK